MTSVAAGNLDWGGALDSGAPGVGAAGGGHGSRGVEDTLPDVELAGDEAELLEPFLPRRDVGGTAPSLAMSPLRGRPAPPASRRNLAARRSP